VADAVSLFDTAPSPVLGRKVAIIALPLAIAACVASLMTSGPSGAAGRKYVIAYVAGQPLDSPRVEAIVRGGRAAAKKLGVQYIAEGLGLYDPEYFFRSLIAQHVDAIASEGYEPTLVPILTKARAAGIVVLSSGDDIAAKRSVWVNYSDPVAYAEALADALASQMKGRGEYAITRQPGQFPIADEWTRLVEKYVARTYPKMRLDGIVEGSDSNGGPEPSKLEHFMATHPKLKGFLGIVPRASYAAAIAITETHKIGKVFSAGNGDGSFTGPLPAWVRNGSTEFVYGGDPVKIGYLTVWAARYLVTGHRLKPGAYNVGGPIGLVWYHAARQELRLGQPLTITKATVDVYANRF
jgi:ABC-type sugar transport system substrate-binding protein